MNKLKIFTFVLVILIQRINAQQNCNLSNHDMNVSVEYIENLPLTLKQRISHKDIYGNHYFKEGKRKIYEVDQMMKFDKNTSFKIMNQNRSFIKKKHEYIHYQQHFRNIPIIGAGYMVEKNEIGDIVFFEPKLVLDLDININPKITDDKVFKVMIHPDQFLKKELVIYKHKSEWVLAWCIQSFGKEYYVDANSGIILLVDDKVQGIDGTTFHYGVRNLNDSPHPTGTRQMKSPNGNVKVYKLNDDNHWKPNTWQDSQIPVSNSSSTWDDNTDVNRDLIQAMYVGNTVFDAMNANSIPFASLKAGVLTSQSNSYSLEQSTPLEAIIQLGNHGGSPFGTYDIFAHEMGHSYIRRFFNSSATNEGDRLHEGIADCLGEYIENKILGSNNWIICGEDPILVYYTKNRNLSELVCYKDLPANSIPHLFGRVIGHWFYVLSVGDSDNNISALGMDFTMTLLLDAVSGMSNNTSSFATLRSKTLSSVRDEFGVCSIQFRSVSNAWNKVCVTGTLETCPCDAYAAPSLVAPPNPTSCPFTLGSLHNGTIPQNAQLVWSTDNDPVDGISPIITEASISGTYYAYYYNQSFNCFGPSSSVNITIPLDDFCSPCHAEHKHLNLTEINGVVNITVPTLITENLKINSAGVLNVYSDLYVAPGKSIIVARNGGKLNISNYGHITSCSGQWGGIIADENSIITINVGNISKAIRGISANNPYQLNINSANFLENIADIEIIGAAGPGSAFSNSRFYGEEYGVELFGDRSLPYYFTNCTFAYHSRAGILTNYGASVVVSDNCQFIGCNHGVSLSNLFSNSSQNSIGITENTANQFINCYNGLYAVNSETLIQNNHFSGNDYGVVFRGINTFQSGANTHTGSGYAELIDGTYNSNQSHSNQYSTDVGIYPHNSNDGYTFVDNCFNTAWWDVDAHGYMADQFKDVDKAAGNCFSGPNEFECYTNNILYGVPDDPSAAPCLTPDDAGQNFTNVLTIYSQISSACGAGAAVDNPYSYLMRMGCDFKRLKKSIDSLQAIIKSIKALPYSSNSYINRIRLSVAERHLRFAIKQWAWCLRKDKKFRELKDWYKEWAREYPNDKYFALEVAAATANMKNYSLAKIELDSIGLLHSLHPDILSSLKMTVDVLAVDDSRFELNEIQNQNIPMSITESNFKVSAYTLSPEGYALLRRVAVMTHPEAAYGRALLSYLTGEMIDPDHASPVTRSKKRDVNQMLIPEIYKMYPNPANDQVIISIANQDPRAEYRYSLINFMGQTVGHGSLQLETFISTREMISGLYTLRIIKNGTDTEVQKLIIQK